MTKVDNTLNKKEGHMTNLRIWVFGCLKKKYYLSFILKKEKKKKEILKSNI